ncbi:hypothetical protein BD309DRAFT_983517 [Dichomitus squalens]|nr:hypothetical protein BD309DRAFT_983517 [Dichomitus squalens]
MGRTRRTVHQKAQSAGQLQAIRDRRLGKENFQPYHNPPPIQTCPHPPLCSASDAHPNTQRAQDETKQKLDAATQALKKARHKMRNGHRREKRAQQKLREFREAEENRRKHTKSMVEAVREEERGQAAKLVAAVQINEQAHAHKILQDMQKAEQAIQLMERQQANIQVQHVQAVERQRADELVSSIKAEYARQFFHLEAHGESLMKTIATLQESANERQLESEAAISEVRTTYTGALDKADTYLDAARSLISSLSNAHDDDIHKAQHELTISLQQSEALRERIQLLQKENISLQRRIERFPGQQTRAIEKAVEAATECAGSNAPLVLRFKVNGVIPESIRTLVRDLVGLGLKVNLVKEAIMRMASAIGVRVEGDLSKRTASRAVKEGGVIAQMQVVEELQAADSTSNTTHFLGVTPAPNHTSETQFNGLLARMHEFFTVYNASPLGRENPIDPRTFPLKLCGMMTDHAADQKKLFRMMDDWVKTVRREVREETATAAASLPEFLLALAEETKAAVEAAGGETAWRHLSPEALAAKNISIQQSVAHHLGEAAYLSMPEHERQLADLFIHGGCCMHKDLNAFKGGATRMAKYWAAAGLRPPVLLMNKDNAATAAAGPSAAQTRAVEQSRGGGPKHAEICGTVFRHRDDKKGQQDSMRWFFLASRLAKLLTFPDTSNTRYGSYGDAASVLIAYLDLFLDLLSMVVDRKDGGEPTNLERNVRAGLEDDATLAEHCAMSLYSQSVSHPYMRAVRSRTQPSHLSLGPLHAHVLAHIQNLIDDPDLLLGPNVSYETAVLDGQPWDHPDAITGVHRLLPRLPYLREIVIAFLQGALETWQQFTIEFAPGGTIAQLTEQQRQLAAMPATNDRNEGALGLYRYLARTMPNISVDQYNARTMWHQNKTATYAQKLTTETHKFIRTYTREQDASGSERKRRLFIADCERTEAERKRVHRDGVAEKKMARQVNKLKARTAGLTVPVINEQLDWHCEWADKGGREEKQIPIKRLLPNKRSMLRELRAAVRRYKADGALRLRARGFLEAVGVEWLTLVYEIVEDEGDEEGAEEDAVEEGDGIDPRTQSGDMV